MTKPDTSRHPLSQRQHTAIDLLVTGHTITHTAEHIGTTRQTVSNWLNHHIPFITELNQRRHQRTQHVTDRYHHALTLALDILTNQLDNGDPTTARYILQHAHKHLTLTKPGPTTHSGVTNHIANHHLVDILSETTHGEHVITALENLSNTFTDTPPR